MSRNLTDDRQIDERIPCWGRLEVHTTSVEVRLILLDVLHPQLGGVGAELEVSPVPELVLVTPPGSEVPGTTSSIVTRTVSHSTAGLPSLWLPVDGFALGPSVPEHEVDLLGLGGRSQVARQECSVSSHRHSVHHVQHWKMGLLVQIFSSSD